MLQAQQFTFFVCILALSCVPCSKAADNDKKLKVTILYESLCPDSVRFMAKQLAPSYSQLQNYINVELVPFGKSYSENDGAKFYCQHGPAECRGNRLQSCVLRQTSDQQKQVKFVTCQMAAFDRLTVDECANSVDLNPVIGECVNTAIGTGLQLQAEKITRKYNPQFVPTIVYDDVFNQELQDRSIRNFHNTVCYILSQRGGLTAPNGPCA